MTQHNQTVMRLLSKACVYIPFNDEACRIEGVNIEDELFTCVGEETGEYYNIKFAEVDLDNDMFYEMRLLENK